MADTPNSALGKNKKMAETDIALVKKMYCGKLNLFSRKLIQKSNSFAFRRWW